MKSLQQYIIEGKTKSFSKDEMIKLFGKASAKIAQFTESFTLKFLSNISKKYSLTNKENISALYTKFSNSCGKKFDKEFLKSIFMSSENSFGRILLDNIDLINSKLEENYLSRRETKGEKAYKKLKGTPQYNPLQEYDENDEYTFDEDEGRAFIIYYAYDPADKSLLRVFRVKGKTTDPSTVSIINAHKAEWNYETKLGYFHANPCLVENYRKSGKEQLIQDYISNDNLSDEF